MTQSAPTPTRSKRGRKPQHYQLPDGSYVHGLARRPSDGRWRIIATGYTFTEPDPQLAVHKFYAMTARQKRETVEIPFAAASTPQEIADVIRHHIKPGEMKQPESLRDLFEQYFPEEARTLETGAPLFLKVQADGRYEFHQNPVDADAFYPWLRRFILDNKKMIAERTGLAEIAYLTDLRPPEPEPTFDEIEKNWETHTTTDGEERRKVLADWRRFVDDTGVKTISEITDPVCRDYMTAVRKAGLSGKRQQHLFNRARRMLRFAAQNGMGKAACKRALESMELLKPGDVVISINPKPIDPADFQKLLAKAEGDDRAMLLLTLNAALHLKETADLNWSDIRDGCLVARRKKKGKFLRLAVLWPETLAALAKVPRKGDRIFYGQSGEPITVSGAGKRFRAIRKAAGLSDDVTSDTLRDGASTAVAEANVSDTLHSLYMGHRAPGMRDVYAARNPKMVQPACDAVYRKYFGA
jgi:integrase